MLIGFSFQLKDFLWTEAEKKWELLLTVDGSKVWRDQQLDEEGGLHNQKSSLIFLMQGTKITEDKKKYFLELL
jgi:hypothetical protein